MTVDIPDNCECTDDEVCNHCIWNTAYAIVEATLAFNKIAKEIDD